MKWWEWVQLSYSDSRKMFLYGDGDGNLVEVGLDRTEGSFPKNADLVGLSDHLDFTVALGVFHPIRGDEGDPNDVITPETDKVLLYHVVGWDGFRVGFSKKAHRWVLCSGDQIPYGNTHVYAKIV